MLQHQIVQSPARLGLSNPTSPSLQNPTPPKFPATSSSHLPQPTPTPSSALLPLLPPFPRAQTLLSQMASLSSKLFDASPNRALWLSSFRGSLPTFNHSAGSTPDLAAPASTKEILAQVTSLQTQLFKAVAELQEILDLEDASNHLAREVKGKDSIILTFAHKLKEAERVLDILVDDYEDYRPLKRAKPSFDEEDGDEENKEGTTMLSSRIKLSDVLTYAHRISYTTFAPPEFGAGLGPLRGALPPAPQDEQMRASQLYAFAELDVGLPKMAEGKEKTIEAIVEPPPPPMPMLQQPVEGNALGSLSGLLPSNIMVPSGWKPGMPVELPMDLPVPPPGWKPGDPLPPLESIAMPKILEQQFAQPAAALHKPPEPIQVRHVQLDILDQDDDSSDYSSDEGSSDDDD